MHSNVLSMLALDARVTLFFWVYLRTILNMPTVRKPATQRDDRDLKPGAAEETVLHRREVFVRHGVSLQVVIPQWEMCCRYVCTVRERE